jgi:tartronate-semialdehyde synthase
VHVDIEPTQIGRVFMPDFGIVSDAKAALELFVQVARERKAAGSCKDWSDWAAAAPSASALMQRKTHYTETPIKPQRVYEEMNKVFGARHDVRHHHRPEPDRRRAVPARVRPAPVDQLRPGRPAGLDDPRRARRGGGRPDAHRGRPVGRLRLPVPDRGAGGGCAVPLPYVQVLVNNSYLGLIRQSQRGFEMDYCVQLAFENQNVEDRRCRATASTTWRWWRAWAARRCA